MTEGQNRAGAVLDAVTELIPQLREMARETELARTVLPANLEALRAAGVFKLSLPRDRGGYEASLPEIGEILAQLARGCPSTSWVASLVTVGNWWAGLLPDEGAEELLSTPDLRTAGVFAPTGTATPVDGGVELSGRWAWNTGGNVCNWAGLAAIVITEAGPVPHLCLVPYDELTVLDDWDAAGMAGTASNTTIAENVFVPSHRLIPVPALLTGGFVERHYSDNPRYNAPVLAIFAAASAGPLVGAARGALDVFLEKVHGRAITYTSYVDAAVAPVTHLKLGEAVHQLEAAEHFASLAYGLVEESFATGATIAGRVATRAYVGRAAFHARESVTTLFQASGASAIAHAAPIQRYFRDVHALANHALLQPNTALELYGRTLAGQEPNTIFI